MISIRQEIDKNPTENLAVSPVESFVHSTLDDDTNASRNQRTKKKKTTENLAVSSVQARTRNPRMG
jgi:hypothetical protein